MVHDGSLIDVRALDLVEEIDHRLGVPNDVIHVCVRKFGLEIKKGRYLF